MTLFKPVKLVMNPATSNSAEKVHIERFDMALPELEFREERYGVHDMKGEWKGRVLLKRTGR